MLFDASKFPHYKLVVPKRLRDEWESTLTKSLLVELAGYFIAPIACLLYVTEPRKDRVKRKNKQTLTMDRQYLIRFFRWLQTHDNAVDEGYWGMFFYEDVPEDEYLNSWWIQYKCRVLWVWRNMAYTYQYETLGKPKEDKPIEVYTEGEDNKPGGYLRIEVYQNYFRYEWQKDLGDGTHYKYQFGWKAHRSAPPLSDGTINVMYANKIIDFNASEYE